MSDSLRSRLHMAHAGRFTPLHAPQPQSHVVGPGSAVSSASRASSLFTIVNALINPLGSNLDAISSLSAWICSSRVAITHPSLSVDASIHALRTYPANP